MKEKNKLDKLLTELDFSVDENIAFRKCLNIIRMGQNDPNIKIDDEMRKIIKEMSNNEI